MHSMSTHKIPHPAYLLPTPPPPQYLLPITPVPLRSFSPSHAHPAHGSHLVYRNHPAYHGNNTPSLLLQEIGRIRPAVLCLQELQGTGTNSSHNHAAALQADLSGLLGYTMLYERKTGSRSRPNLGNALLYRRDIFKACGSHMLLELQPAIGERCQSCEQRSYFGGPQVSTWAATQGPGWRGVGA